MAGLEAGCFEVNTTSPHSMLHERLQLQRDCTVTPTVIRQGHWVIIKNVITGGHIRLHRDLWLAVRQFEGNITVQEWVKAHAATFGDQRLLSVIAQLRRLAILNVESAQINIESTASRFFVRLNPLMLRLALFNPTPLLNFLCRVTAFVSVRGFFTALSIVALSALYTLMMHWSAVIDFWQGIEARTQLWYVVILYPLTKFLHELAHGLALRRLGGEVPEAGISFLVLFPMPYIDATDAWSLHRKPRMLVSAAGMLMDLLIACCGILIWSNLSSGVIANLAFTAALMGAVSILLFNANPLLKFDGYYLLEDALDSPGLARRSQAFYRYLFKRHVLNMHTSAPPVVARGEKLWLLAYGASGTLYRYFIAAVICIYLISILHELGVFLALFSLIPLFVFPAYRFLRFLFLSTELANLRIRAITVTAVLGLFVVSFIFTVPLPSSTRTQGVVWVEKQAEVYAAQTGQLEEIFVNNGDVVKKGQPLMRLGSLALASDLEQKLAAVRLARIDVGRYRQENPSKAAVALITLRQSESEVEHATEQINKLTIRSPAHGRVAMGSGQISTGLQIPQGTLLAYVVDADERVIRAVVDQAALGSVESGILEVHVRLAQSMRSALQASVALQVPSCSHKLPSAALANTGFDGFDVDQIDAQGEVRTLEKVFHIELVFDDSTDELQQVPMGTRAYVTLQHAQEPLAHRWIRLSRRLLIKHLSV